MDLSPLSRFVLRTSRLEIRWPDLDELQELGKLAEAGVHPPDEMPFLVPWTDPSATFVRDFVSFHQGLRAEWSSDDWKLELGVFAGGIPVGMQALRATGFSQRRTVETGSWLGQPFQGRGYGTEMRTAVVALSFVGLGAKEAQTTARATNAASQRVSAKVGYEECGENWPQIRGVPTREVCFRLTRENFLAADHALPTWEHLADCRPLFGIPEE